MIRIINRQRNIFVDTKNLQTIIDKMLKALDYEGFDIGIWLTTNATIHKYNKNYRGKDKPTDILSFPFHPTLKPGDRIVVEDPEDKNVGDIIISLEYVKSKAPEWKRSFEEHLIALLAHGFAHLLNYDHQTDEEYAVMQHIEKKLIKAAHSR